jgi:hypothetical protein
MSNPFSTRSRLFSAFLVCAPVLGMSACGPELAAESDSLSSEQRIPPPPDCLPQEVLTASDSQIYYPPDGCEPPPPPEPVYYPPTKPGSITYTGYTVQSAFPVSWGYSSGSGLPVTYELHEQRGSGYWQQIYQGASRSYTVSGRAPSVYRYRVRACNTEGCSLFMTGPTVAVSQRPTQDLYSAYPYLSAHDQQNAQYAASTQGFRSEFALPQAPLLQPVQKSWENLFKPDPIIVDGMFHLGQGFDVVKDNYADICINTSHPAFRIVSVPSLATEYRATRAVSITHLRELLDVGLSGGISASGADFNFGISSDKQRFVEQISDSYQESVVVKWARKLDKWYLDTAMDPLKPDFIGTMVVPGNPNARLAFRNRCGDKYIHGVTRGARIYVVFQFDAKKYTSTEREQHGASLELAIKNILSANGSSTISTETQQMLARLNVTVEAYAIGGDESIRVRINRDNFAAEFNAFVNGVSLGNSVMVEQSMRSYDHPTQYLNHPYFDIYADPNAALQNIRRWNALDIELAERCNLMATYSGMANYQTHKDNCRQAAMEVLSAKDQCLETYWWPNCKHPLAYYTAGPLANPPGPLPTSTLLYNWMGTNVPRLERETQTYTGNRHVSGGFWDKECGSFTDDVCLSSSACAVDSFRIDSTRLTAGYSFNQTYYDCPGSGGSVQTYLYGTSCLRTATTICTSRFGDTTAGHEFTQEIYGQCPQTRQFALVF